VTVVIADLTATACRDRSIIRHLLRAHRKATARGGQVRFVIRPGGALHRITEFVDMHPLLAVYPTLQRAIEADYRRHPAVARAVPEATITAWPSERLRKILARPDATGSARPTPDTRHPPSGSGWWPRWCCVPKPRPVTTRRRCSAGGWPR